MIHETMFLVRVSCNEKCDLWDDKIIAHSNLKKVLRSSMLDDMGFFDSLRLRRGHVMDRGAFHHYSLRFVITNEYSLIQARLR